MSDGTAILWVTMTVALGATLLGFYQGELLLWTPKPSKS
jgi:hypothetical protein